MLQKIISFGFKYGDDPLATAGVAIIDVRRMFNNPYRDKKLRYKNGLDPAVQVEVLKTPNFRALYEHLKQRVTAPGLEVVYIGCTGGHHRSVFLAEKLARELRVQVEHRDLYRS